jgi:succinylarginine dihydrolase
MTDKAHEVNFDGLVGPTHNYGGLAYGNLASMKHGLTVSNPKAAVLQGLEKMKVLADLGVRQALLPPPERPDVEFLRRLGFSGSEAQVISAAGREDPTLLAAAFSASGMWAANAATVSPSADTADRAVHFTPANLLSQVHRAIEAEFTDLILKRIFKDAEAFVHHPPIPGGIAFRDEGAANHIRLSNAHGEPGIEIFVYASRAYDLKGRGPECFPARQTLEASTAISRLHRLDSAKTAFISQNPELIDAGVFHNDVICVGNENVLFCHSRAFADQQAVVDTLKHDFAKHCDADLVVLEVSTRQVPVADAVQSYLFNSQLVSLPNGNMVLLAPREAEENPRTHALLMELAREHNPIAEVVCVDTRQSMRNGGGPACLRLRVVLTEREEGLTHQGVFLTDQLYGQIMDWAGRHYRDRLSRADLLDPNLPEECRAALDELSQILDLGSIYGFQAAGY